MPWWLLGFGVLVLWALLLVWRFRGASRRYQRELATRCDSSPALPPSVAPPPPDGVVEPTPRTPSHPPAQRGPR